MHTSSQRPGWLYNEFQFTGVDYADTDTARVFETRHRHFRNFEEEFQRLLSRTGLKSDAEVIDLGCGTGAWLIPLAKYCKRVRGIDPSPSMLKIVETKLADEGLDNATVELAGFLSFSQPLVPVDAVVSSIALHHLPDFWKAVALRRVSDALKPGGVFYLVDVVFRFPIEDWESGTSRVVKIMGEKTSANGLGKEAEKHISSEYSSFDWILEGMFSRVGLEVESYYDDEEFLRAYVCRKTDRNEASAPSLSVAKSRRLDELASERLSTPTSLLMENAARSLTDVFLANASRFTNGRKPRRVLICCGKGNNGGDGFALFRQLESQGIDCKILACAPEKDYTGDAALNLKIARAMTNSSPEKIAMSDDPNALTAFFRSNLEQVDWIVDALLGIGMRGELRSPYDAIASLINDQFGARTRKPVYSVDVPSGLNADSGEAARNAIRATMTTTLGAMKNGLVVEQAKPYVGELFVGSLGVPVVDLLQRDAESN